MKPAHFTSTLTPTQLKVYYRIVDMEQKNAIQRAEMQVCYIKNSENEEPLLVVQFEEEEKEENEDWYQELYSKAKQPFLHGAKQSKAQEPELQLGQYASQETEQRKVQEPNQHPVRQQSDQQHSEWQHHKHQHEINQDEAEQLEQSYEKKEPKEEFEQQKNSNQKQEGQRCQKLQNGNEPQQLRKEILDTYLPPILKLNDLRKRGEQTLNARVKAIQPKFKDQSERVSI